ncbi:colicin transporter [Frateuria sp. Soil773]|uniref:VWA domain-containing protein n=1 Tax=Frateuria sp. Soil773 TaxID=1736407 RepID=UPI0006FCE22D|nr:VWA domain-containing protein [Frateuria sp. Soil773]KRE89832.1 colicin transporter [Frateuria sp. Soil773]
MSAWQQFHFLRPWWLLALAGLPLLMWWLSRGRSARQELARLVDAELLPHLLRGRPRARGWHAAWLGASGLLCVLALAGPAWDRVAQPLYANRAAQVVAISLSPRMLSRDVAPSRLDRARYKTRDLFAANHDGLNGLIGYAGEAFVVAPLTNDANSLNDLLEALAPDTMPVEGDDAAAAIERGAALIHDAKVGSGTLVLVTDRADAAAEAAARKARADGVTVSVLGVGTPQGGPVPLEEGGFMHDARGGMVLAQRDDKGLAALAAAGGGRYVAMRDDRGDVEALHASLGAGTDVAASGQRGEQWQDRGPWLLLLLLPLAALASRRGVLLLLPLLLLPLLPGTAQATSWSDLWQRRDQQAAQALHAGDAKRAQQLARDPAWRGAAAYRAGDYAAAAQALRSLPDAQSQYNLGNALAKAGEYQPALDAYDRALELDPGNADAKANRKAVEDWLRRQSQQQPSSNGSKPPPSQGDGKQQSPKKPGEQDQDAKDKQDSQGNKRGEQDQGRPDSSGQQSGQPQDAREQSPGAASDPSKETTSGPPSAQEQAEQRKRAEQAQQALQQQMNQALGGKGKPPAGHELGALSQDDPQSKLPPELRQALQRVPDDPGALLRRKFELEYRQRHGGAQAEDGQP